MKYLKEESYEVINVFNRILAMQYIYPDRISELNMYRN